MIFQLLVSALVISMIEYTFVLSRLHNDNYLPIYHFLKPTPLDIQIKIVIFVEIKVKVSGIHVYSQGIGLTEKVFHEAIKIK